MLPVPAITTHDDRARPVTLWRPGANPHAEDTVPTDLQLRIAAVTADRHKGIFREPLTAAHLPLVAAFLALACTPLIFGAIGATLPAYWVPAIFGLVVPAFLYFRTRAIQRGMADTLRTTLLAEGYCAACGYSMRGLNSDADGCTTCPECSAAWRLAGAPPHVADEPRDPHDIEQDRAARRQLQNTLRSFGLRRRFGAVDASGRIVGLVSPDPFASRPAAWHRLDPKCRYRLRRRFLRMGLGMRILFALITIPGAAIMIWTWARMGTPNPLTDPLMFLGRIFGTFIWPVMIALFVFRPYVKRAEVLVKLLLEEGRCPSCVEPLTAQPLDTHATCRACGAMWDIRTALIGPGQRDDGSSAPNGPLNTPGL